MTVSVNSWLSDPSDLPPWALPGWLEDPDVVLDCNVGAPMSRRRTIGIQSSILGRGDSENAGEGGAHHVGLPRLRAIAIDFHGRNPVAAVHHRLAKLGFASPEEAKAALLPPLPRCFCFEPRFLPQVRFTHLEPAELLEQALILGLSNAWLFDPDRPVIWTKTSLTRRLVLYASQEFYA